MEIDFVKLIAERIESEKDKLKSEFLNSKSHIGTRFLSVDNLLPEEIALEVNSHFPKLNEMREMNSFREHKFTSKNFDSHHHILKDITFAIQDKKIIELFEYITDIKDQIPDETLYAGGLSSMAGGNFLNPHIDNSHEANREYYRTLNLLYYVSPSWKEANGGNLELWDLEVKQNVTIHSKFNRLVIMETTPTSWHSVSKVLVDNNRNCVSNYYFSKKSPLSIDYFNVTEFSARPEQKMRRFVSKFDNKLRGVIRAIKPDGIAKKDLYDGGKGEK